ncbi:MAG TPA: response regulator transcription factor [Solirubrobacterales bacterium]|jgi:two-component system response regulator DesR
MVSREPTNGGTVVAVCSEDGSLRDRVSTVLADAGHAVLSRSASAEQLLASCNGTVPACAVVAADAPGRSTAEAIRLIRSRLGEVPAVLVCRRAGVADVRRALELGADGVVLAADADQALAAVVVAVCAGQVSAPAGQRRAVRPRALTSREKQILTLVVAGLTNSQIAAELFLAESTVKSHLSSAFGKLGVSSRSEAVAVILDPERGPGLGIGALRPELLARG